MYSKSILEELDFGDERYVYRLIGVLIAIQYCVQYFDPGKLLV